MAKIQNNAAITADGSYKLGTVRKKRDLTEWFGLFYAYGTFGSGTIAWQWSPDGGTTKLAINDLSGAAITSTSNDNFVSNFATGSSLSDGIDLYITLTGSTNPSITVGYYDNNY